MCKIRFCREDSTRRQLHIRIRGIKNKQGPANLSPINQCLCSLTALNIDFAIAAEYLKSILLRMILSLVHGYFKQFALVE